MNVERKTRVLICDDSSYMRKVLQHIVTSDPQLEVAGEARDGRDAVSQAERLRPDVITMDINMPLMDGLQATEVIMSSNPRPILIVSSESRAGADITLKALELGAIDFVPKPNSGVDLDMNSVREDICRKLKMASKVRVVRTASRTRLGQEIASSAPRSEPGIVPPIAPAKRIRVNSGEPGAKFPIVVIAASTGGPATLMKMMPAFPSGFPGAVVIVQHMPGNFTGQFAEQLNDVCSLPVKEAKEGDALNAGHVYVCPGANHLEITPAGNIAVRGGPRVNGYLPCADISMNSVAEFAGPMGIGIVLTGMGNDGVQGAQTIRRTGGSVIVQDESTSVIFGMNAEVVKASAADQVLALENIVPAIEKRVLYLEGACKVGVL